MAITFVAATQAGNAANTATVTPAKPTGLAVGDLLIATMSYIFGNTPSAPAGWTQLQNDDNAFANAVYYKIATSTETAASTFTFGQGATGLLTATVSAWRGARNVGNPINANTETITGTGTTLPAVTGTTRGLVLYYRALRTATTGTATTFSASGVTKAIESNASDAAQYSQGLFYANADVDAGVNASVTITANNTATADIRRAFVIEAVPEGSSAQTLPSVTSDLAGETSVASGPLASTLPKISASLAGEHYLTSEGPVATALPKISAALDGLAEPGGFFDFSLPSVSSGAVGAVEPIGALESTLPSLSVTGVLETQPRGGNVIVVEAERRAFIITDDDMRPAYRHQVNFPKPVGLASFSLPSITVEIAAETVFAGIEVTLPLIGSEFAGQSVGGDFAAALPMLSASVDGASEAEGPFEQFMPQLVVTIAGQVGNSIGGMDTLLPAVGSDMSGTVTPGPDGSIDATLPKITSDASGEHQATVNAQAELVTAAVT